MNLDRARKWERIIIPILTCFGKLNSTYWGKLWQPHYSYRSSNLGAKVDDAKEDKGPKVDKCLPSSTTAPLVYYYYSRSRQMTLVSFGNSQSSGVPEYKTAKVEEGNPLLLRRAPENWYDSTLSTKIGINFRDHLSQS